MSDFKKALLWTASPIVVLSLIGTGGSAVAGQNIVLVFGIAWVIAVVMWVAALIVMIIFAASHKGRIAAGILAGLGISIVALGVSCFAIYAINYS